MSATETTIRPYYFLLGKKFKVHHKKFLGPVYVSPEAIYALANIVPVPLFPPLRSHGDFPSALFGPGLGGKVGEDRDKFFYGTGEAFDCDLSDLPESITSHVDWPWKSRKRGRVFIVPRSLVHHASASVWGYLTFDTEAFRLRVDLSMFRVRRVRRHLDQADWPPV